MSSVEEHSTSDQLNCGEVISGELVISGGDATKLLELIEEALDEVAFAVKREITSALDLAVSFGRDHGCHVACR